MPEKPRAPSKLGVASWISARGYAALLLLGALAVGSIAIRRTFQSSSVGDVRPLDYHATAGLGSADAALGVKVVDSRYFAGLIEKATAHKRKRKVCRWPRT